VSKVTLHHSIKHQIKNKQRITILLPLVFLTSLFKEIAQRLRWISQRKTFQDYWGRIFYRLDALQVAQTTVSKHWRTEERIVMSLNVLHSIIQLLRLAYTQNVTVLQREQLWTEFIPDASYGSQPRFHWWKSIILITAADFIWEITGKQQKSINNKRHEPLCDR